MDDSISRQAALDAVDERLTANGYSNVALVSELNRLYGILAKLPSAERHGKWVDSNGLMRCSICGKSPDEVIYIPCEEWNYCPNCGSRMDLEGEEE